MSWSSPKENEVLTGDDGTQYKLVKAKNTPTSYILDHTRAWIADGSSPESIEECRTGGGFAFKYYIPEQVSMSEQLLVIPLSYFQPQSNKYGEICP